MEMIENCQNKADVSSICRCQITSYDKESEVPLGHRAAPKLLELLLFPTKRPSSTDESGSYILRRGLNETFRLS
jgi:hypothetical protein